MNMKNNNKIIYLLMTISAVFWAGAFIAGKVTVKEFPPFSLTFLRFFFASIFIFITMIKFEEKDWRLKREDYPVVIFLGIVGMVGYHVLFFLALKYTTAINSSMIAATNPLITTILAATFLGEKLSVKRVLAIFVAFAGVVLTVTRGQLSVLIHMNFNLGDLLMMAAVTCWATYTIVSRYVMPKYSPLILSTYSFIICGMFTLPFALMEKPMEYLPQTSLKGWAGVLYMSIFPSYIGYLVQQYSIREIGPSKTSIFINLVPVFSLILSVLILKESVTIVTILSGALIILGVYLTSKYKTEVDRNVSLFQQSES